MKLAWLVKRYVEDDDFTIVFHAPEEWRYEVIKSIVYAKLE